jgi:diacylglycerol kinase (ATP)
MNAALIVNPVSGRDAAPDYLPAINALLRERAGIVEIFLTAAEGDASTLAAHAVRRGADHLFVCGGDGTVNEVINGLATVPGALQHVRLGIIPLGTGNDFATALGLPAEIDKAIAQLFDGRLVHADLGRLNDRSFVNVSAGGFIAEVSDAVNEPLKNVAGKLAYLIGGAQVMLSYEPITARIAMPDGPATRRLHAFAVCNSRLVGGGRLIAPHAVIDDGLLDVCLIEAMPTMEFVNLLRRVAKGDHVADDRVTYFTTRSIELTFDRRIKVNTDGQVLETDRCRYEVVQGGLWVMGGSADGPTTADDGVPSHPL